MWYTAAMEIENTGRTAEIAATSVSEDDENAEIMAEFYEFLGFVVVMASDSHQGVDMAAKVQPDLVLLDIMLPKDACNV